MFESDDPELIMYARGVCSVCPARSWCDNQAEETLSAGLSLMGVWGGRVYGDPSYLLGEVAR